MLNPPLPPNLMTAWKVAGLRLLVVGVVLGFGFAGTWEAMFKVWIQSETYGHGVVVIPISVWLLWRDRAQWLSQMPKVSWLGLPLVLAGSVFWLLAELARVNVVAQYGLLLLLYGLVWMALGWSVIRVIAFALAFLFFMVPAGDSLNAPLMEATATATISALRAVGLPVFREGMIFTLPTGQWSVVEACSGLRYVLAAAMLGALFAWLNFSSWRLRVAFFTAAIVLALVGNWARAWLVVMIGHLSEMRYGTGDDHVWYGWVFFGLVMGGLFWMGGCWKELEWLHVPQESPHLTLTQRVVQQGLEKHSISDTSAVALAKPDQRHRLLKPVAREAGFLTAICIVGLAIAASTEATAALTRVSPVHADLEALANRLGVNREGSVDIGGGLNGARWTLTGQLRANPEIQVAIGYFARQTDGYEMITFGNGLPNSLSGWPRTERSRQAFSLDNESRDSLLNVQRHRYRIAGQGDRERTVLQWYWLNDQETASDSSVKGLTVLSLLRGRGDHSLSIRVGVPANSLGSADQTHKVSGELALLIQSLRQESDRFLR